MTTPRKAPAKQRSTQRAARSTSRPATPKKDAHPRTPGRPRADVSPKQVLALAKLHCTYEEIAAVVGCSTDTLKRRFAEHIEKGREEGKASLRRVQFKRALDGNTGMLIWLGKQMLGQSDKQAHELTGKDGAPIAVAVDDVRIRIADRLAGLATRIAPVAPAGSHE